MAAALSTTPPRLSPRMAFDREAVFAADALNAYADSHGDHDQDIETARDDAVDAVGNWLTGDEVLTLAAKVNAYRASVLKRAQVSA